MAVFDALETIGDRRMYLSTTSMTAGYVTEILMSLELYKDNNDPQLLRPSVQDSKRFLDDFLAALEERNEATFTMRKLADNLAQSKKETFGSVDVWKNVRDSIEKAERGEDIPDVETLIRFLRSAIDDLNDVRKLISDRLHGSQRLPPEYL
jgi:hypothetical protein